MKTFSLKNALRGKCLLPKRKVHALGPFENFFFIPNNSHRWIGLINWVTLTNSWKEVKESNYTKYTEKNFDCYKSYPGMFKVEFKHVVRTCITLGGIPSVWSCIWSYSPPERASDFYIHFRTGKQQLKQECRQSFVSATVKGGNANSNNRPVAWAKTPRLLLAARKLEALLAKTTELLSRSNFIPNHSCKYTYWLSKQPWCKRSGTRCSGWCFLLPGGGVFYLKDSKPRFNYSFRSKHSSEWDDEKTHSAQEQQPTLPKMYVDLNSKS